MEAAKHFEVEILLVPKSKAGTDAKAPAVYLNERLVADAVSLEELCNELRGSGVPERSVQ